jgi:hypothetical protein
MPTDEHPDLLAGPAVPFKWGSIGSDGGRDSVADDSVAEVGVEVVTFVVWSAAKVRKGDGATNGRWNRVRKSLVDGCCDGSPA